MKFCLRVLLDLETIKVPDIKSHKVVILQCSNRKCEAQGVVLWKQKAGFSECIFLTWSASCMVSYFVCLGVTLDVTSWQDSNCFNPYQFVLLES